MDSNRAQMMNYYMTETQWDKVTKDAKGDAAKAAAGHGGFST
jgi:hypothetical protein